jgi:CRISPR-associated Cas5-like protein
MRDFVYPRVGGERPPVQLPPIEALCGVSAAVCSALPAGGYPRPVSRVESPRSSRRRPDPD